MQISYGTVGFRHRTLEAALTAAATAGYTHVEISSDEHLGTIPTSPELERLRKHLRQCGLSVGTVHGPMRKNVLGAPDEEWRTEKVGVLSDYLRLSGELGAAGMVIHPVPNPTFVENHSRPELTQIMIDATRRSLDELVPVANTTGVRMLLENLPYHCHYPFLTMTELRALVEPYPEAAVGLVIDTGHAWTLGNDPAAEILTADERLWGTHLQDVDGEDPQDNHWAPTQGDLDWKAIRQALLDVSYRGFWTFEVITPRRGESDNELAHLTYDVASALGLYPPAGSPISGL